MQEPDSRFPWKNRHRLRQLKSKYKQQSDTFSEITANIGTIYKSRRLGSQVYQFPVIGVPWSINERGGLRPQASIRALLISIRGCEDAGGRFRSQWTAEAA
jgi:hypothetical protein